MKKRVTIIGNIGMKEGDIQVHVLKPISMLWNTMKISSDHWNDEQEELPGASLSKVSFIPLTAFFRHPTTLLKFSSQSVPKSSVRKK